MSTEATLTTEAKPLFTAKEEEVMRSAWICLKNPPEVDIQLLVKHAGFNNPKTATNVWAVIKRKLVTAMEANGDGYIAKADAIAKDATPCKKRARKANTDDESAPKKQLKAAKKSTAKDDHPFDSDSALSPVKEELTADTKVTKKAKAPVKTKAKATKVEDGAKAESEADADAEADDA